MGKILYVGSFQEGATVLMRLHSLTRLGHEVFPVTTQSSLAMNPWRSWADRFAVRLLGHPGDWSRANAAMLTMAALHRPEAVLVDKGTVIKRATLMEIKSLLPNAVLAHFNPDDPFGGYGKRGWSRFLQSLDAYDVHFVPRKVNISEYRKRGAQRVIAEVPSWGYDPEIHQPRIPSADFRRRFAADIGFVGNYERERAGLITAMGASGLQVRVVGQWPQHAIGSNVLYTRDFVRDEDYAMSLQCFKIALCFLRKNNRDLHTSRSVEIPACGAFMLAERTSEHAALFEEDREAAFFSSTEELLDKARFYLSNDALRRKIAEAGRMRCERSGYSNDEVMRRRCASMGLPPA